MKRFEPDSVARHSSIGFDRLGLDRGGWVDRVVPGCTRLYWVLVRWTEGNHGEGDYLSIDLKWRRPQSIAHRHSTDMRSESLLAPLLLLLALASSGTS